MRRAPAVFLDRDGTLNWDRAGFYVSRPEHMRVYRRAPAALRLLRAAGFKLVVVSNQSGIGRGYLDEPMLRRIHARLKARLARGGARLDAIYYCTHHPDRRCSCRKPLPTLARRAARRLGLSIPGSFVVGDKPADIGLARALGVPGVLLLSGQGRRSLRKLGGLKPDAVRRDVLGAARWILRRHR